MRFLVAFAVSFATVQSTEDADHVSLLQSRAKPASETELETGCISGASLTGWSDWDAGMNHVCSGAQAVTQLVSKHDNGREDRVWKLGCSGLCTGELSGHYWSSWANSWDGTLEYTCPTDYLVVGLQSVHDNGKEDRRWAINCASTPPRWVNGRARGANVDQGSWSDWINGWDGAMDYSCPAEQVLTGVYSVHHNGYEDRLWKARCGALTQFTPSPTPSPTPYPTPSPTPSPTPYPTPYPTPSPTPSPTLAPTPTPTPLPTPAPTPQPTTTTTTVDTQGLDGSDLDTEVRDESENVHECRNWCYSKKHKNKAWEEKKCTWFACSTCAECTTTTTTPAMPAGRVSYDDDAA
jgi:hypothetical protein